MEALEGRRDEAKVGDEKMTAGQNSGDPQDRVERWIEELRKDLEEGDSDEHKFEGLRSEAIFWRVLERIKAERSRGSWLRWLARSLKALASLGGVIGNPRAF